MNTFWETRPTTRIPIGIAVVANLVVAATTYALRGWSLAGDAHAAARNTARFSALWFIVAFASPGLAHTVRALRSEARLVQSFFAAHIVHFATVVMLLWRFESAHVYNNPIRALAVIGIGFGLVSTLGLTATPRSSRVYTAVHKTALYAVFLIFFLAFVRNRVLSLRMLAVGLGMALILRVIGGMTFYRVKTAE
jgi:hypothetical protein